MNLLHSTWDLNGLFGKAEQWEIDKKFRILTIIKKDIWRVWTDSSDSGSRGKGPSGLIKAGDFS